MKEIEPIGYYNGAHGFLYDEFDKDCYCQGGCSMEAVYTESQVKKLTDKLSVEKLQEQLENCIHTLIEASVAATITQDIVVGNIVDRKLADLAKNHKLAVDYIEKVTGKKIDVVLAENAAFEAEEENE